MATSGLHILAPSRADAIGSLVAVKPLKTASTGTGAHALKSHSPSQSPSHKASDSVALTAGLLTANGSSSVRAPLLTELCGATESAESRLEAAIATAHGTRARECAPGALRPPLYILPHSPFLYLCRLVFWPARARSFCYLFYILCLQFVGIASSPSDESPLLVTQFCTRGSLRGVCNFECLSHIILLFPLGSRNFGTGPSWEPVPIEQFLCQSQARSQNFGSEAGHKAEDLVKNA